MYTASLDWNNKKRAKKRQEMGRAWQKAVEWLLRNTGSRSVRMRTTGQHRRRDTNKSARIQVADSGPGDTRPNERMRRAEKRAKWKLNWQMLNLISQRCCLLSRLYRMVTNTNLFVTLFRRASVFVPLLPCRFTPIFTALCRLAARTHFDQQQTVIHFVPFRFACCIRTSNKIWIRKPCSPRTLRPAANCKMGFAQVVCAMWVALCLSLFVCLRVWVRECDGNGHSSVLQALLDADCNVHDVPLPDKI